MDLSATKGYRVPVRTKVAYTEGSSIKVPSEDWALSALGASHFAIWSGRKASLVSVIPKPEKIMIMHWQDIRNRIPRNINRVSVIATLAHLATLLIRDIRNRKKSGDPFIDKFSSLIYGASVKTGTQWKPASGGLFPLDFLYDLIESNLEISGNVFEIWDHVFRIGNKKGREDLSLSLSEFIAYPTADNLENYLKIHLRYLLKEDVPIRAYPEECIKEVLRNVRS